MPSAVSGLLQTMFVAVLFTGAGYLITAEIKRHNRALEDFAQLKELFYENYRIQQEIQDVNQDLDETNKALYLLRQAQTIQYNGKKFD